MHKDVRRTFLHVLGRLAATFTVGLLAFGGVAVMSGGIAAAATSVGIWEWINGHTGVTVAVPWDSTPSMQICLQETTEAVNLYPVNVSGGGGWAKPARRVS